jgi:hypothetical protein
MTTLRDKILKKLEGATSQHPMMLDTLRKAVTTQEEDAQHLYDTLDAMHAQGEVNRVSGYKDMKQYIAYWPIPTMARIKPVFRPYRDTGIPASAIRAPEAPSASQAKAAAPHTPTQIRKEPPPMQKMHANVAPGTRSLLAHITDNPGLERRELVAWYEKHVAGATREKANSTLGNLVTRKSIVPFGDAPHTRYYVAGTDLTKLARQPAPTRTPSAPGKHPVADHENAIKAAQGANLLVGDLKALAKASNPLVGELATEMLITAHQLSDKLNRLAGHIHQLQGA